MNKSAKLLVLALVMWMPGAVMAEDIDLFRGVDPKNLGVTDILLVMDNAANFSSSTQEECPGGFSLGVDSQLPPNTVASIQQCALSAVIRALPNRRVRLGVMMFASNGLQQVDPTDPDLSRYVDCPDRQVEGKQGSQSFVGGCVMFPMTLMDSGSTDPENPRPDTKSKILNWIKDWKLNSPGAPPTGGSAVGDGVVVKSDAVAVGSTMQEAWAYLTGAQGLSGASYDGAITDPENQACSSDAYVVYVGQAWEQTGKPNDAPKFAGNALNSFDLEIGPANNGIQMAMRATPSEDLITIAAGGGKKPNYITGSIQTSCLGRPNNDSGSPPSNPNLNGSKTDAGKEATLTWTNVPFETSYMLERYAYKNVAVTSQGSITGYEVGALEAQPEAIYNLAPNETTCRDRPLAVSLRFGKNNQNNFQIIDQKYQYRLVAVNGAGQSLASTYDVFLKGSAGEAEFSTCDDSPPTGGGNQVPLSFELPADAHEQDNEFYADEWARYLETEHGIRTYTIGLTQPSECFPGYPALMSSMASAGKGKYYETTNFNELLSAFTEVFSLILATNSVFASVSLPISVNTQDTYLNQVYIGMFRPDGGGLPRWMGNLKQYRLGFDASNNLRLEDADGDQALADSATGFLDACSRSLWSPSLADAEDYWPTGGIYDNCASTSISGGWDAPDGQIVEKGGSGYVQRMQGVSSRNMWTCSSDACTGLDEFDTNNNFISVARLGADAADTDAERVALIEWARGNNNATDVVTLPPGTMRPSVHGDVVHSRPKAINFQVPGETQPKIVIFYGANDGTLRAINGNLPLPEGVNIPRRSGLTTVDTPPGGELWSFIPPEFFPDIKRLRDNNKLVSFADFDPCVENPDSCGPKPYGFDGPITTWTTGTPGSVGFRAIMFATMRRGGRMVYAFDVTGIANGTNPTLLWRFGCNDAGLTGETVTCVNNYSGTGPNLSAVMGQTWSSPQPAFLQQPGPDRHVVIFGGGYDECEDLDTAATSCASSPRGNGVYVLDAVTGDLLRWFATERSVVADPIVVSDSSGFLEYVYVTDLGGNIYRLSGPAGQSLAGTGIGQIESEASSYQFVRIARLGCTGTGGCNRKFFYPPDVIRPLDGGFALLVGSGDREKPLPSARYPYATAVQNYFFALRDFPTDATWLDRLDQATGSGGFGCAGNYICMDSLAVRSMSDPSAAPLADSNGTPYAGWALELRPSEQTVTGAITVFGTVIFSSHTPENPTNSCTPNLGIARAYQVNYRTGEGAGTNNQRSAEIEGGGLPPSPVAGLVLIDGETYPFVIGASARSALEAAVPGEGAFPAQPKGRRYWYIQR